MTYYEISCGITSFQTFIFREDDEGLLVVMSRAFYPNFQAMCHKWKEEGYVEEVWSDRSTETDLVYILKEKEEAFLAAHPQLAAQLVINSKRPLDLWVTYPQPREEIDIIHTPEDIE